MKRIIVALAVGSALFGVVAFAAATLNLNAGSLSQSGMEPVTDCAQGNTVNLAWVTSGSYPVVVTAVKVDVPYNLCVGATATVEVLDSGGAFVAATSCTLDGYGDCTAGLASTDVDLVDQARVTLSGP